MIHFFDAVLNECRIHSAVTFLLLSFLLCCGWTLPRLSAEAVSLRSGCEIDYPPFCIVDEHGRASGFSVELLRAALQKMNRNVSFATGSWPEVRGLLERGEIDLLPLVGRTPEREELFDFTVPYMTLHGAIVVRDETRDIFTLEDLRGRQVAVLQGDNAEEFLRRQERGIDIHCTASFNEALHELSRGLHDAVVIQRLVALRLIKENGLKSLRIVKQPLEDFRQSFCFAVKKGDSKTLAMLNEGLAVVMADGTYRYLHAKWFAALELPAGRRIVVGGDENYPPFEYLDEKGLQAGYNMELTKAVAKAVGLEVEIRLGPWVEILEAMDRGEIDILQGMFYLPVRDLKYDFSQPHSVNHYVSIVRRGEGRPPRNINELKGKRIIVQRRDVMHDFLISNNITGPITLVENQEDLLRELAAGMYDCALGSRFSSLYFIQQHGWDNLVLGKEPFESLDYCYAVPNGHSAILAQFNEGLRVLQSSGEYRKIYEKWFGVYQEKPPTLLIALRYSAMVLLPLLLLLLLFLLWSWALRRQVSQRTRELQYSLERFRLLAESAPVGIIISDIDENILFVSPKFTQIYGYKLEDMPNMNTWRSLAYPDPELKRQVMNSWGKDVNGIGENGTDPVPVEFPVTCKDGRMRQTEFRLACTGKMNFVILTDVTEHRNLEEKLRQAQKLEAVGRLAGGVAHDYNNMLSVIIGFTEMGIKRTGADQKLNSYLQEVLSAAKCSAEITRQLLAFARKQTIIPKILDLNETVESMLKMLRRLIGEDIELAWLPATGLGPVKMDPTQIDQILVNLCVNARDAIAGQGKITIQTENAVFDEEYCAEHSGFLPGDFVLLSVTDSGCGMDKETQANIFEPFYSTKGPHGGTGLGLATVYGIVKQNNGFINVYSEPGQGTCFKIYLERQAGVPEGKRNRRNPGKEFIAGAGEKIILVEDEPAILKVYREMLEMLGYSVLATEKPEAALKLAEANADLRLLITDVVMPEMSGRDLAGKIQQLRPGLKTLFMSGYTANVIAHRGILDKGVNFVQKPVAVKDLAKKVRQILEEA